MRKLPKAQTGTYKSRTVERNPEGTHKMITKNKTTARGEKSSTKEKRTLKGVLKGAPKKSSPVLKNPLFDLEVEKAISQERFKARSGKQMMKRADGSLLGGFTWSHKKGMLELGCNYHYKNSYRYYISQTENIQVKVPPLSISIDYKYFFDLSLSSLKRQRNGELEKEFKLLRKNKALSSVTLALGPAYSFFSKNSDYNNTNKPFLDDHRVSKVYPDIGIGYYHYKLDATINLSNRFFSSMLNAYGYTQKVKRNSIALEVFKFLGDYHGFVPFIGGVISYEKFRVRETENETETFKRNYGFVSTGIIAGWDIRPTRTDWWGVRTNIRFFPGLKLDMPGGSKLNMQQVELNFLQMVFYTGRIYTTILKKKSKDLLK